MKPVRMLLLCLHLFIFNCMIAEPLSAAGNPDEKEQITAFLNEVFKARTQLLKDKSTETISRFYDEHEKSSRLAKQQEIRRSVYLQTWAQKRGIFLSDADVSIRITRLRQEGDVAKISLIQTNKISYKYDNEDMPAQTFGFGTRHALTLKKTGGDWHILREWYLDPIDENPNLIPSNVDGFPKMTRTLPVDRSVEQPSPAAKQMRYNREKAVAYANKYAGAAWGAGNNGRYNVKYRDYTYQGGDCTNFTSQALGDREEGGGLRMAGGWRYVKNSGGSVAWVQTDGLKNFLLHSGYARLIKSGTFTEVVRPSKNHPRGAAAELKPGDVIAYVMDNDVDHFSIVVGHDDNGYPLVNSHTADRYRMPFDLGWDKSTSYMLIHINE